ncbi:hypothetical protein BT93_D1601 [Corymbia citriodora subsp. variegata]|nr:hypothetical protein BT93_D1601 [Corymbia citriodora subsp. variegata]
MEERYDLLEKLGSGKSGVVRLARDKKTKELVAVKYIERGEKIDKNVQREIINHRSLRHPNIVRFKEVLLTPTHLAVVMEYAAGGQLLKILNNDGRFTEDEARVFFQQLISGVSHFHSAETCHRDLKLESILLDGSPTRCLKICDFGYSRSTLLHSQANSAVGTLGYIAPEVLLGKEYDGKIADVWSCGVTLYVMLVGGYPFEDPHDPGDFRKTNGRISIPEIKKHPWFLKHLPKELIEGEKTNHETKQDQPLQNDEEVMRIIQEARTPGERSKVGQGMASPSDSDEDADLDSEDDNSGEFWS